MQVQLLDFDNLISEAKIFAIQEGQHTEPVLFGVDNGKTIGTYLEQKFRTFLTGRYLFRAGNSASGIDFPDIGVDVKTTSIRQPQSSSPFRDASQKVYGLGYALLVFVYDKEDEPVEKTATLRITNVAFAHKEQTADFQMTFGILEILDRGGNIDDLVAFFFDKGLPGDEIVHRLLAERVLNERPVQGYLTISKALQWRLQYSRLIVVAGTVPGIESVYRAIEQ